jgi:hypothetical protein
MLRFSTPASADLVASLGEVHEVSRESGLTMFAVSERNAPLVLRDLADRFYAVQPGWPRGTIDTRGYATASAHIRRG